MVATNDRCKISDSIPVIVCRRGRQVLREFQASGSRIVNIAPPIGVVKKWRLKVGVSNLGVSSARNGTVGQGQSKGDIIKV